jgi:hypothetical protein
VENLKKIIFDKATDKIGQRKTKNIPITESAPLSVFIETLVTEDVRKDLLSITYVNTAFTLVTGHNLKDMVHENKEKDDQIRELEEEVGREKKDKGILKEFKICTERVKEELNEMATNMYSHLQVFQRPVAQFIVHHS